MLIWEFCKFASTIDSKILWYNFLLLFFIVLLPFSTAFYVKGFTYQGLFAFCCFSLSAIGFFNLLLNIYIVKKEKGKTGITPTLGKFMKIGLQKEFKGNYPNLEVILMNEY